MGLTPPDWWTNRFKKWQKPAWEFCESVSKQIGKVDDLYIVGDAIDGPGYKGTTMHITTDIGEQCKMAEHGISLFRATRKHLVKGTGFHTDGHTSYEDIIADALGIKAHDELRTSVYGRLFHVRHVVGRSDTPYGQHTQDQKEMINEMLQAELEDYKSADVLLRAHVHYCTIASVADASRGIMRHVYTAPSLQLRGPKQSSFTRRLRTWLYHFGITLIETDPKTKEVFIRPILMPLKSYMRREYICLAK